MLLSIIVYGYAQTYRTVQLGGYVEADLCDIGWLNPHCGFERKAGKAYVYGLSRGTAFSIDELGKLQVYKVVQVVDIDIPKTLDLNIGDTYIYSPIITDKEAYHTELTWTSSNPSVATVNSNGEVTTLAIGQTVITCSTESYTNRYFAGKPTNSVSSVSVITVSPVLTCSIDIEESQYNIEVGQQSNINYTILPENASNKTIKWLSSNDNIVQVNDEGVLTGISPGYCSVYAITDDTRKFDKVLVHVEGKVPNKADVNGDGAVSVSDAVTVVDVILSNQ